MDVSVTTYVAKNPARSSQNRIHSDETAKTYGFRGALVPGIVSFAYAAESVTEHWGEAWLEHGSMGLRYQAPVYEDEPLRIELASNPLESSELTVTVVGKDDSVRSAGSARLHGVDSISTTRTFPLADPPAEPMPMSEDLLLDTPWIGSTTIVPSQSAVREYLNGIGLKSEVGWRASLVHPAYLARTYRDAFARTFARSGPSLHASSSVRQLRSVRFGEALSLRGRVDRLFGRNGNRYMVLDLAWYDDHEVPVMSAEQCRVYRLAPRP